RRLAPCCDTQTRIGCIKGEQADEERRRDDQQRDSKTAPQRLGEQINQPIAHRAERVGDLALARAWLIDSGTAIGAHGQSAPCRNSATLSSAASMVNES